MYLRIGNTIETWNYKILHRQYKTSNIYQQKNSKSSILIYLERILGVFVLWVWRTLLSCNATEMVEVEELLETNCEERSEAGPGIYHVFTFCFLLELKH